ncbi:MAG: tRNA pseudouridine(55) synthase TruB [Patescibacteria group bacterium]|jgi:tRNA pseudouridine55 synthase
MKENKKNEIENEKNGFILINKNSGPTSHDIIYKLRKISKIKKIGHAGTLDPLATGLLIVAIGRPATKNISNFVKLDKKYEAEIFLGETTDTYDREGKVLKKYQGEKIKQEKLGEALQKISKRTSQIPPMYSAKKIKGQKLYELARKNIEIQRPPQKIEIYSLKLMKYRWPKIKLEIHCSSGTYIRSIAHDLGEELGCGAYLKELKRTAISKFLSKKAVKIEKLTPNNWQKYVVDKLI